MTVPPLVGAWGTRVVVRVVFSDPPVAGPGEVVHGSGVGAALVTESLVGTGKDEGGQLVHPAVERLASYRAALERGWSPNTMNPTAGQAEAKRIDTDPAGFLAAQDERGYATTALRLLLPEARALSLPYVELTTDLNNTASQKVITTNGGVLIERFERPAAYGSDSAAFRWRIRLQIPNP